MDNPTQDMNELLVRYLDGDLEGTEKDHVAGRISTETAWSEAYEQLLATRAAIRQFGLKQQVQRVRQQMADNKEAPVRNLSSRRRVFRSVLSVAAALLVIIAGFLVYSFYNLSSQNVFKDHYHSYELNTLRGNEQEASDMARAYRAGNYAEVTRLYPKNGSVNIEDNFLAGMAWLEQGNAEKAIPGFQKVLDANKTLSTPIHKDDSEYYLALAYILNKDFDLALPLLRKIKEDPNHTYHSEVTSKLLRQVKLLKWR